MRMNVRALTPPPVVVLTAAMWVGIAVTAAAQSNAIQIENAKPGSTDWLLTRVVRHDDEIYELGWHRRRGIEAYASHTSVTAGDTLNVHVSTYPAKQVFRQHLPDGVLRRRRRASDAHHRPAAGNG